MKLTRSEFRRILPIARRRIGNKIVAWVQRLFADRTLKRNVFGSKHERRALICYLPEAFNGKLPLSHSNFTECYTAAKVFHELGFIRSGLRNNIHRLCTLVFHNIRAAAHILLRGRTHIPEFQGDSRPLSCVPRRAWQPCTFVVSLRSRQWHELLQCPPLRRRHLPW